MADYEPFARDGSGAALRGFLHRPERPSGAGLVLAHGAGSDSKAPVLVDAAVAFAAAGFTVLRCDLPFRQARQGPPRPAEAAKDRQGIRSAVGALKEMGLGTCLIGGHSYGGRQATMLAAEEPELAAALILLSYPLHPPKHPEKPRTAHLPHLRTRAAFVHGSRDPFGTIEEMNAALELIPADSHLFAIDGAGHDLRRGKGLPWSEIITWLEAEL
ncbi:MAG: alpha/beta fold hydrolase [Bryobacteraceae bacterium]